MTKNDSKIKHFSKKEWHRKNTCIASIIGVLILLWVIFKILFPVSVISNNTTNDFAIRNIGEKKYLQLKLKGGYPFHRVVIKLNSKEDIKNVEVLTKIYQDELGLYTTGEIIKVKSQLDRFLNIESNADIKNGELISKGNSVYIISDGQYRAFANAEVFDLLGFDWERVQDDKESLLENLTKGNNITKATSYLQGSFVGVEDKLYLLGTESRYFVDNKDLVKNIKDKFSIIHISSEEMKAVGKMKCQKKGKYKVVCNFKDDAKRILPQATVLMEINDDFVIDKWKAKIYTFDKLQQTSTY